ncbi:MAG: BatD family protein [Candidatus Omnitrophota bacterium]
MNRFLRYTSLAAVLLCAAVFVPAASSSGLEIKASVDRPEARVGDRITLKVTAQNAAGYDVIFPEKPQRPGNFSFVAAKPVNKPAGRSGAPGREYVLTVFKPGTYIIPPVQVKYKKPGEDEWKTAESPGARVEVATLLTGKEKDIRGPKGLLVFGNKVSKIFLVAVMAAAYLILFRFLWTRRKNRIFLLRKKKSLSETALEELKKLKGMDLPAQGRVKEFFTGISGIIRVYIENRFSYRAPEMTTEEFLAAVNVSGDLLAEHKALLRDFLSRCDMVKFAKYGPTNVEIDQSYDSARRLVEQTASKDKTGEKEE